MSLFRTREAVVFCGGFLALLVLPLLCGCTSGPPAAREAIHSASAYSGLLDEPTISHLTARMQGNLDTLRSLCGNGSDRKLEYLLPREHDHAEGALTEYLACREELQQIAELCPPKSPQEELGLLATVRRAECDIALASATLGSSLFRRTLNQAYYRSGISAGTGDRIVHELTDSQFLETLVALPQRNPIQPAAFQEIPAATRATDVRQRIVEVIRQRSLLLPAVENEIWHSPPTQYLASAGRTASHQYHRIHGAMVTGVGRLKNPAYQPLEFTPEQRQQIRSALQPGDVLLTFTAGYASNYFIPGTFKHAATFVGTEAERRRAGLPAEKLTELASPNNHRLVQALQKSKTADGEPADVVESLAEGVLVANFDRILTTRINRLAVLRPKLTPDERAWQLMDVLSYVGDEYDFSFDLTDGSDQVCTEVVYRSLQGRGRIHFSLTEHAGRNTLTADEIVQYQFEGGAGLFDTVLIVTADPRTPGKGQVLFATEAEAHLIGSMERR